MSLNWQHLSKYCSCMSLEFLHDLFPFTAADNLIFKMLICTRQLKSTHRFIRIPVNHYIPAKSVIQQSVSTFEANYAWLIGQKRSEYCADVSVTCFMTLLLTPIFPATTHTHHIWLQTQHMLLMRLRSASLWLTPQPHFYLNSYDYATLGVPLNCAHVQHRGTCRGVNGPPPLRSRDALPLLPV